MADTTLGEFIRQKRVDSKLTLREFARRLGLTASYVSDIENDRRAPSEDVLTKIGQELGVPADELIARAGRLATGTQRYLREVPAATTLFRRINEKKLNDAQIRQLLTEVDRISSDSEGD